MTSSKVDGPHLLKQVTAPEIERVDPPSLVKDTTTPDVKKLYRERVLKGMQTAEVENLWYKSLDEEDCVAVMMLLEIYPGLLRIGWGNKRSKDEGTPRKDSGKGTPTTGAAAVHMDAKRECKQRTALHVAARRGSVDLIKQVLTLCEFDVNNVLGTQDIVQHWKSRVIDKNSKLSEGGSSQHSMDIPTKQGEAEQLLAKGVLARWKRKVAKRKESHDLPNAAVWGSPEHPEDDGSAALSIASCHYGHLGSLDLWDLLHCVDSEYRLDAFHMTAVNGREDHLAFLTCAKGQLERKFLPYPVDENARLTEDDKARLAQLRTAMQDVMARHSGLKSCLEGYESHLDFNFLPLEQHPEYLFHYSFTSLFNEKTGPDYQIRGGFRLELWEKICSLPNEVWRFLLHLQDGQGRPPIHVAIAEMGSLIIEFFDVIDVPEDENDQSVSCAVRYEARDCAMSACDAAGRTPAYRAAATGNQEALVFMQGGVYKDSGIPDEIAVTFHSPWKYTVPPFPSNDSRCTGEMYCCTPLHAAIIHSHADCVKQLLKIMKKLGVDGNAFSYLGERSKLLTSDKNRLVKLGCMDLALIAGDKMTVKLLHENGYIEKAKRFSVHDGYVTHLWPSLHIAAAHGDYEMLKWFTDSPQCGLNSFSRRDYYLEDFEGNSPLHHTLQLTDFGFTLSWLDCVTFDQILSNNSPRPKVLDDKRIAGIQGCVNLLMQAGFDTFVTNKQKRVPHPQGGLSENGQFLSWWYETQMADSAGVQTKLNNTANAISVTATLIASASYIGPLQPPLGYDTTTNQIQYENGWVAAFIFFDNVSFYGAILALTISLVPYLQGPRQAVEAELKATKIAVKYSTVLLLYAMFTLLISFALSSMAVVSDSITSSVGGKLTVFVTSVYGGCSALVVVFILWLSYKNSSTLITGLVTGRKKA